MCFLNHLLFCLALTLAILPTKLVKAQPLPSSLTRAQQEQLAVAENSISRVGELYRTGKTQEALQLASQSLANLKTVYGQESIANLTFLDEFGTYLTKSGRHVAARPFLELALDIRKKSLGAGHPETARSLDRLGTLLRVQGDTASARPYYEEALKIRKKVLDEKDPYTAVSHNNLGFVLQKEQDYTNARTHYEQALTIFRKILGEEHDTTATALDNLGRLFYEQGDYASARTYFEDALGIRRKVLGEMDLGTAQSLNNMGLILQKQGDYAAALPLYGQALEINKKILGDNHPSTALSLHNLGLFLLESGDYVAARSYLDQALTTYGKSLGEESIETAVSHGSLGGLLKKMGEYSAARTHLERALKIHEDVLGDEHPYTADSLNNMGGLLSAQGDYAAARPYYERALKIRKTIYGESHPETAISLNNLSALEVAQGRWDHAGNFLDESRRGVRRHIARILPLLSDREQSMFLQETDKMPFHSALSLGLAQCANQKLSRLSAGWLLNSKGVAQSALAERTLLTRDVQNPKLASSVHELLEVRRNLAGMAVADPKPGDKKRFHEKMAQLTAQEERLARELNEANGRVTRADPWVELSEVQKALPVSDVLIDIARFEICNFLAKGSEKIYQPAHYAAWIIPTAGDVQIVDLGPADKIDDAVARTRETLDAITVKDLIKKHGEVEAEQKVRQDLQAVADLVWKPLSNKLGNAKRLVLSPDATLWLLPWGSLPVAENKFLIEQYAITYLISGRNLVANRKATVSIGKPVVVANPDFDLTADGVQKAMNALLPDLNMADGEPVRALSRHTALQYFPRLNGSANEVKTIKSSIEQYTGVVPQVYTDQNALETIVKQLKRPKMAVLSTHGFFLPDREAKVEDNQLAHSSLAMPLTKYGKAIENPLLRCGLLFAGCNASQETKEDDGILSGIEIVGIDLRGTELVVLSACETGVGQVRNGEGVAGLRQAFQLAGAEAVVATLWHVPDKESAHIINDFFLNLAQGQNKTEALRAAQLKTIADRRDNFGAAHAYLWAGFTLTGF